MENNSTTKDRELIVSTTLTASIELVWEAWTNPQHIAKWWGPNGFTNTITKMDIIPGGEWDLIMHGPDGTNYENKSVFKEIIPYRKIVYQHVSAPIFTSTIEFETRGRQIGLNWHMLFETPDEYVRVVKTFRADEGLKQNVEKLSLFLAGMSL